MKKLLNKTASSETRDGCSWREKPWIFAITFVVGVAVGTMVFKDILMDIFF